MGLVGQYEEGILFNVIYITSNKQQYASYFVFSMDDTKESVKKLISDPFNIDVIKVIESGYISKFK